MVKKSEKRTLLMSVVMSAPRPLILAFAMSSGQSSTQLADFFRRSAELLALICSLVVFCMTETSDAIRKNRWERVSNIFVGAVMCFSGVIMIGLAIFAGSEEKGNVSASLVIALLGMIANSLFWLKYRKLNKQNPNAIIAVQARLYRVKAMIDTCVTIALAMVAVYPQSNISDWFDRIGSVVVAIYLILCGIKTIYEADKLHR